MTTTVVVPTTRADQLTRNIPAAAALRPNLALLNALTEARVLGVPGYAVAAAAHISPALLSMIARGRVRATADNAAAIAGALGLPASVLFPEDDLRRTGV